MGSPFKELEHVPIPAYVFRVVEDDFVLEQVNAVGRALNPGLESLLGKPMVALYRDQPNVLADATRALTEGAPVTAEYPIRRYDRTTATQYARLTFAPAPPSHLVIYMQEMPSESTMQSALLEAESRYRSLVASLPDGLLVRGIDGRVIACNEVTADLVGAACAADLLGRGDILSPGYKIVDEAGVEHAERGGPSREVLETGVAASGRVYSVVHGAHVRWLRIAAQPIRSEAGAITGSVTTFTDITDRVVAQRALRESADRLALALSAARMGVWEYDAPSDTGWWSDNLGDIFKMGPRETGLASFLEAIHPEDAGAFGALATRLLAESASSFEHEFRIVGSDGVTRWARVQGRIAGENGKLRAVGTVMDVTERHRLEEELGRAHRLESIGRLAGGIAHDFNNLLAAMMGSLELIDPHVAEAGKEDLATISHAASRARDLTKQLLAFARKQPVELGVVDIAAVVGTVELMLRRLVGPAIELSIAVVGPLPVLADAPSLEQVLVNLVVNARDAMPGGGRLEVRAFATKKRVSGATIDLATIEVVDSGVGMDENTRAHVFDPFFTTKSQGTGLGLASSYGTVKQHGGDIEVESTPGRGTTFRVELPIADVAPSSEKKDPSVAPRNRRGCVLVVDDEALVRSTTVRVVESLGYEVVAAANAAEAAAIAADRGASIDVLLCDVAIPGRDGPSIARELRAVIPSLSVVFVSGYADVGDGIDLSNASFLQKPFSRSELAAKLAEITEGAGSS